MRLDIRHLPWHWLTISAAIGLLWAAIGLTLWHDHTEARNDAEKDTANLTRSFDESITRTVEAVDQTLLFIREGYQNDRAAYAPQAWAQSRSLLNDLKLQISIVDRNGRAIWSNLGPAAWDVNIADREHFQFQKASKDDTLFISQPVIGRRSNRWSIQFVRKLLAPDGSFDGVVVVSLDPTYLARFYESIAIGNGSILLDKTNGTILVRVPATIPLIGRQMPPGLRERVLDGAASGRYRRISDFDQVDPSSASAGWKPIRWLSRSAWQPTTCSRLMNGTSGCTSRLASCCPRRSSSSAW